MAGQPTGERLTAAGRLRTNESPGKEDENRGFAWKKRYVEQRATPPADCSALNHDSKYLSSKIKVTSRKNRYSSNKNIIGYV